VQNILSSEGYTGQSFHNIPVTFIERPVNRGSGKSYGATGKIDFRTDFINSELNSYIAYTYIDGEIGDAHLPYTAKNTIKAGIDFKYKRISMSPRLIYRSLSKHRNLTDEQGNIVTNDPFTIVNFTLRYTFLKKEKVKSDIYLKAINVLNNKLYNLPIGGRECFINVPQDPIRLNLGIDVRF